MPRYDWKDVRPYIEENIDSMTYKQMADNLNIPYQRLRDYARHQGFVKYKSVKWTDEILEYMRDNYKLGAVHIAEKFRIPLTAIYKKAQELGLKYIPRDEYIDSQGYRMIGKSLNRKAEHRLVMEEYLGRELESTEIVHHIDGNKLNNDISNLTLTTRSEHIKEHREDLIKSLYSHDIV